MLHLQVHSTYSLLEGVATPAQLVAQAVTCGMEALAITDTRGLYGAIPFYQEARAAGIRPILGVSFGDTLLLARDRDGYARLCAVVTAYHLGGHTRLFGCGAGGEKAALFDVLSPEALEGVLVVSPDPELLGCLQAVGVEPLAAITHDGGGTSRRRAESVRLFALEHGLRPVAVCPVRYLRRDHARYAHVLEAIRRNTTVEVLRLGGLSDRSWFRTPGEMGRLYADWPETLANLDWVAEQCAVELTLGKPLFPEIAVPEGETPFSRLWALAFAGVCDRYRPLRPEVTRRLQEELDVIHRLGFAPYFLIVADIVRFARDRGIPVTGRGSAANSLTAYALGITRVDPFQYDLYFERFLNPARTDCPDIDLDLCWRRRDEVIRYVYERYGADRVAMVGSFNTFRARGAVREVAKAAGLADREVSALVRGLPHYHAGDIRLVAAHLPECRHLELDKEPLKSVVAVAEFIDGFPRHLAMHPCGLVIAPGPLTRYVPLQRAARDVVITQYDMGPIEALGLVKMDLLGHRSLTVVADTIELVSHNRGIAVDPDRLPDPDPLTADLIRTGRTIGCFQIESPAMRALLQHTRADSTDLLIKTLSLVRPGPSGSGMKRHFIDRHLGREPAEYLDARLEPVLGDTYGVMLYQEDILKVAHAIAGMSLADADGLRRAMSKKRVSRDMERHRQTFLDGATAHGVAPDTALTIWEQVANFSKYAFCKAHAATYGEIAYQCAYLKAHFPAEFLAAVLSNRGGFYHPAVYLEEAKRCGVAVLPPDVNQSGHVYTVEHDALRTGLVEIRGLSLGAVQALCDTRGERPFSSLTDLCRRTGIARSDAELLVQAGACDRLGASRTALMWELRVLSAAGMGEGDCPLLAGVEADVRGGAAPRVPGCSRRRAADLEWGLLGFLVSGHPIEYYLPLLTDRALILSRDLPLYTGRTVSLVGWLIAERHLGLDARGVMKFLTLEDPAGVFEAVLFPEVYQRLGQRLGSHGPFFLTGTVQEEDQTWTLIVEDIECAGGHGRDTDGHGPARTDTEWRRADAEGARADAEGL